LFLKGILGKLRGTKVRLKSTPKRTWEYQWEQMNNFKGPQKEILSKISGNK
jgi:hypothetical protein